MSLREELDEIWDKALKESPCECGNDNKWEQDLKGTIRCVGCNELVSSELTPTLKREKKRI